MIILRCQIQRSPKQKSRKASSSKAKKLHYGSSILLPTSQSSKYIKKRSLLIKIISPHQSVYQDPFPVSLLLLVELSHHNSHKTRSDGKKTKPPWQKSGSEGQVAWASCSYSLSPAGSPLLPPSGPSSDHPRPKMFQNTSIYTCMKYTQLEVNRSPKSHNVPSADTETGNPKKNKILRVLYYRKPIFQASFYLHWIECTLQNPSALNGRAKDRTSCEWETIEAAIEESFSEYFGLRNGLVTPTEFLQW